MIGVIKADLHMAASSSQFIRLDLLIIQPVADRYAHRQAAVGFPFVLNGLSAVFKQQPFSIQKKEFLVPFHIADIPEKTDVSHILPFLHARKGYLNLCLLHGSGCVRFCAYGLFLCFRKGFRMGLFQYRFRLFHGFCCFRLQ